MTTNTNHHQSNQYWIYKFTSNNWIQARTKSNHSSCIECHNSLTPRYDTDNESEAQEYSKLSRFDAIPFKTVEDAWSQNNRILAPYIKAGRTTALLSPSFPVNFDLHNLICALE